ncbi:MAG TPA: VOC family protein [Hyphomonadaceae bacterium]|nr:VOC family protein [Hyphomonadaceae bacterium]HPN04823.1 VOC family protein [Hyphomonadaceae bacterium]
MIGYTTIGAKDIDKALAFYDAILGELGGKRVMEMKNGQLYGFAQGPLFGVTKPFDGAAQHCGNGNMIALRGPSREKVDELHAKALKLGGADEGKPGDRGGGFYGGYFRDLDGNKLCIFTMGG